MKSDRASLTSALTILLTRMLELVPLQFGHLEEAVAAHVARVRALVAVHAHVVLEVRVRCKALKKKHQYNEQRKMYQPNTVPQQGK